MYRLEEKGEGKERKFNSKLKAKRRKYCESINWISVLNRLSRTRITTGITILYLTSWVGDSREAWMCNKRNRGRDRSQPRRARAYWWMNRHDRSRNGYNRNRFLRRRRRYVQRESFLDQLISCKPYGSRRKTQNPRFFTCVSQSLLRSLVRSRNAKTHKCA